MERRGNTLQFGEKSGIERELECSFCSQCHSAVTAAMPASWPALADPTFSTFILSRSQFVKRRYKFVTYHVQGGSQKTFVVICIDSGRLLNRLQIKHRKVAVWDQKISASVDERL